MKRNREDNAKPICYIAAFLTGAIISVMVVFNTALGTVTNNSISITINQITGIVILSLIMLLGKNSSVINPPRESAPLYKWFGGLFGLAVISINYFSVKATGAAIAMASAVLGQCLMGLVFDLTGFMGMKKRELKAKKALSLGVALIGIIIMLLSPNDRKDSLFYLFALLAIASGAITMIQMVYNSDFAKKKGAFFSARQNVLSGLGGILIFILLFNFEPSKEALKGLYGYPIWKTLAGGTLAVAVVVVTNLIIPRMPGAASSILMSSGQILTAVALDHYLYGINSPFLLVGAIIMILGLLIDRS